ncbi:MAG: hypothetical protein ACOVVK_21580 [Elsteraceae bacterium]
MIVKAAENLGHFGAHDGQELRDGGACLLIDPEELEPADPVVAILDVSVF